MTRSRWGDEGPPTEAYSRVTNPERYQPLHPFAEGLLERLKTEFEVESETRPGLDAELEVNRLARPLVRLSPMDPDAAPITVGFTTFPGVIARFGRWHSEAFPRCGCDACDETVESAIERFALLVADVTEGRFSETVRLPEGLFRRSQDSVFEWKPWPKKGTVGVS